MTRTTCVVDVPPAVFEELCALARRAAGVLHDGERWGAGTVAALLVEDYSDLLDEGLEVSAPEAVATGYRVHVPVAVDMDVTRARHCPRTSRAAFAHAAVLHCLPRLRATLGAP